MYSQYPTVYTFCDQLPGIDHVMEHGACWDHDMADSILKMSTSRLAAMFRLHAATIRGIAVTQHSHLLNKNRFL